MALFLLALAAARSVRSQDLIVEQRAVETKASGRVDQTVRVEAEATQLQRLYAKAKELVETGVEVGTGYVPRSDHFAGKPRMYIAQHAERVPSITDIETMGMRDLKNLIQRAGLSSADCIEKGDLQARAKEAHARLLSVAKPPEQQYYAYVVTYVLGEQLGHTIYHTSLAFCPPSDARRNHWNLYVAHCQGRWMESQCWRADEFAALKSSGVHASDCTELAYGLGTSSGSDIGVQIPDEKPWRYANDQHPHFYALGLVTGAKIDAALAYTQTCGTETGKKLDFNANTYDLIGHNCHHWVDAMLGHMELPAWAASKRLPDEFMPEDPDHNPVRSAIVHHFMPPQDRTSIGCLAWKAEQERKAAEEARRSCWGDCGGRSSR